MTDKFTYDENIFSDLFKDVHGFRPRNHEFYNATAERKQQIWDDLLVSFDQTIEWENQRQREAIAEFEKLVDVTIDSGAGDRDTAIRWIVESLDDADGFAMYGGEIVCHHFGLPYSMADVFNNVMKDK